MKIHSMELRNFRCFPLEWFGSESRIDGSAGFTAGRNISFDPKLTVIVAENGQGKTAVLDALRIGLWPFISCFDLAKSHFNDPANGISVEDVRLLKMEIGDMSRQLPCEIVLKGDFGLGEKSWTRSRLKEQKGTKTTDGDSIKELKDRANKLQVMSRNPQDSSTTELPILANYGTGRLWAQKRLMESKKADHKSGRGKDPFI